jgi:WD40 repeat protein
MPPSPDSRGIRLGDVGGDVNFSALGDIVGGDKITTITTTIQISVEAVTQCPLIASSPYRGLDRFEDRDKDLFFGRDQLIKSLLAQLSASNVLLVLGASGSGKSSVVRAGLLPQLSQLIGARFRYFTFVPDVNPFDSLRSALQGGGFTQSQTRELADARPETLAKLIPALQRPGDQWLFFVDQFEEIFTVGDEKLRANFIAALTQIAQDRNSSTKLVLAMRADFLDRFSPFPQFARIIEKNIDIVADMHTDELRQAIEQPAARHGVVFEQGLVEEIIKDVQGQAGSLPLLQYTLDLLWQEEARGDGLADRHLNAKTYRELGGVRGALQKRANEIYASFGDGADTKSASPKQEIVRQIFLRLVDLAGEGSNDASWRPVRRRASIAMFAASEEREIFDALVNQKLLVSNREGGDATVEVAHEALFTSWERLRNWIEAGKQVIFARNRLADDARRWLNRQQEGDAGADEELIGGSRLAQALDVRGRGDFLTVVGGLSELETRFLDASAALRDRRAQEEQARQQRELEAAQRLAEARTLAAGRLRKGLAIAVVLALLAIGGGLFAWRQSRNATQQQRNAQAETSRSEYLHALSLIEDGDADEALRSLARSLELNPANSAVATRLMNLLGQRSWPHLIATERHPLPIRSLDKTGDAKRILVATRSAGFAGDLMQMETQAIYFHDATTLRPAGKTKFDSFEVADLKVNGDSVLATGLRDNRAILLNAKTGTKVREWKGEGGHFGYYGTFSHDGKWVLLWWAGEAGGKLEIVSALQGKPHPKMSHFSSPKSFMAVAMDDAEVRILNDDGSVAIQTLANLKSAPVRDLPVVPNAEQLYFPQFAFGDKVIIGLRDSGLEVRLVSQPGDNLAPNSELKSLRMFNSEGGLQSNRANSLLLTFNGPRDLAIVQHDSNSTSAIARSSVTQIAQDKEHDGMFTVNGDWHSPFAPVCLLSPGLLVAQDSKAVILPFHGTSLSGPMHHETQITALCKLGDDLVATGAADGAVKLWKLSAPVLLPVPRSGEAPKKDAADDELVAQSRTGDVQVWMNAGEPTIKSAGKAIKVKMPRESLDIGSVELSADGELGIFTAFGEGGAGGDDSGAWIFNTRDGTLLSDFVPRCEWAGFTPDAKLILTMNHGVLNFWKFRRDATGPSRPEASGPALSQADMTGASVLDRGKRVATRSLAGEVIVWDGIDGNPVWEGKEAKPVRWLRRDPLWNDVDLNSQRPERGRVIGICRPALSGDGRRLAAAYGRAFVIWDLESGKPLSDPIYCASEIRALSFLSDDSTKVEVTLQDGSKTSWDYAGLDAPLSNPDAAALQKLALAVAKDSWVQDGPALATEAHSSSPAVAKLLEHFASQARALQRNPSTSGPSATPPK